MWEAFIDLLHDVPLGLTYQSKSRLVLYTTIWMRMAPVPTPTLTNLMAEHTLEMENL